MLAVGLLSGGLDSSLAVKMVMDQGINVVALRLTSPFCRCDSGGCNHAAELANNLGIKLITIPKGQEYLDIVRMPKHGRGSGMNPCVDCRIYLLKKAKAVAEELDAKFIFTGEVVGQRPMSQQRNTLDLIEREAGLEGRVVRPLSAQLLPETEAERMGWIDRKALSAISGRGRKEQIRLAESTGLIDYPCPAGGCLLTNKEYAAKLDDFLRHSPGALTLNDVNLLKVGRHFRVDGHKVIIGRDRDENDRLMASASDRFTVLLPISVPGPIGILENNGVESLETAAAMVARYSDNEGKKVQITASSVYGNRAIEATPMSEEDIDAHRIVWRR